MSVVVTPGSGDDVDTVWILCEVADVSVPLPQEHGVVTLRECAAAQRTVQISIGIAEAAALRAAMDGLVGPRPSTHELFSAVLGYVRVDIVAARISKIAGQAFQATVVLMAEQGSAMVDARASDAMVLAFRQAVPAPILVSEASFS
jgi:hypothetical protein